MLNRDRRHEAQRGPQRGLSLVELMVGIAIGLVVVAGAALVASSQISDTRRLLLETQLQQDLRAAADIITRELRRAGSNAHSNFALATVWLPPALSAGTNLFTDLTPTSLASTPGSEVGYRYYRTAGASIPVFGFKLSGGVVEFNLDGTSWQPLTDERVLRVTAFTVTQNNGPAVPLACAKECAGGGTACYPTWQTRELVVDIVGEAVADPTVQRSIRAVAKLRNDVLVPGASGPLCPP
ncbi:PilW family protein [Rubrivivax sp. RP6-9]|uniref:PilW family protein n=1 Tax=Rubrivivax sp. RP6-9 TaxID=3415750 RepID=UPI003CC5940E